MRCKTGPSTEDNMLILPEMVQQAERTDKKEYLPLVTQWAHCSGPWYNSTTSLLSAPRLTTAEPLPALEPSPLFGSVTSPSCPWSPPHIFELPPQPPLTSSALRQPSQPRAAYDDPP